MNKNSALRRFLRNVYGYSFFNKLILLTPVYAVFMQEHGLICAGGAAFVMFSLFYSVSGLWALIGIRDKCALANTPGAHAVKTAHPVGKA